ncbi:hypothetical protein BDN72DRAFT_955386 [Pluteus cervinus]|uniref:Uncharacterized protein n=1 Tax=Pluteus cervinus TaxID=181527 RepID=A0ACD3BDI8_9AGAR|nr:hypothetical protein BDN72DRAFT_955386 [Pluteus cervinus]
MTLLSPPQHNQHMIREQELEEENARLQQEVASLKDERDKFRQRFGSARTENAALQARMDQLICEHSDLKHGSKISKGTHQPAGAHTHFKQVVEHFKTGGNIITVIRDPEVGSNAGETLSKDSVARAGPIVSGPSRANFPTPVSPTLGPSRPPRRPSVLAQDPKNQTPARTTTGTNTSSQVASSGPTRALSRCIPTPLAAQAQTNEDDEDDLPVTKMANRANAAASSPTTSRPIRQAKKDALFHLPEQFISNIFAAVPPRIISPDPILISVPRRFLQETYGGATRVVEFISRSQDPGPTTSMHPEGRPVVYPDRLITNDQTKPGQPALMLTLRDDMLSYPPWTVFHKAKQDSIVHCTYLGEYRCTSCEKLTAEQFRMQSDKAKRAWAQEILKLKRCIKTVEAHARIALRLHGKKPTQGKVDIEAKRIRKATLDNIPVTIQDIIRAFETGKETINIILMECVGYDHKFARDILEKKQGWAPKERKRKRDAISSGSDTEDEPAPTCTLESVGKRTPRKVAKTGDPAAYSPFGWDGAGLDMRILGDDKRLDPDYQDD